MSCTGFAILDSFNFDFFLSLRNRARADLNVVLRDADHVLIGRTRDVEFELHRAEATRRRLVLAHALAESLRGSPRMVRDGERE